MVNNLTEVSLIRDWFRFIFHPDQRLGDPSFRKVIRNFIKFYFFNLLAVLVSTVLIALVHRFFKLDNIPFPTDGFSKTLIIVAIASTFEEVFFRLPLRFAPFNLAFPSSILLALATFPLIKMFGWSKLTNRIVLLIWILILITLLYLVLRRSVLGRALERFHQKRFVYLFYIFNLVFAFIHFTNYRFEKWTAYLIIPIITMPQLITGLILSYLRIRYNIFWSILYHIFWNMVLFVIVLKKSPLIGFQFLIIAVAVGIFLSEILPESWGRKPISEPETVESIDSIG